MFFVVPVSTEADLLKNLGICKLNAVECLHIKRQVVAIRESYRTNKGWFYAGFSGPDWFLWVMLMSSLAVTETFLEIHCIWLK